MKPSRVKPVIKKEFRQILRDKRSLGVLLVLPAFLILLIGYALNFDVKHVSVIVFDQDRTPESRAFVRSFTMSEYFDVNYYSQEYETVNTLLNTGKASAAIVIPPNFSEELYAGRTVPLQILIDGANANSATTILGYVNAITETYSANVSTMMLTKIGQTFSPPIDLRPRIWYNSELSSSKYLLPGLIAMILMLSAVVSTSLSVVREKERGTMEQLTVSPLQTIEIIIGKTIPYLLISLVGSVIILLIGYALFDVTVRGSIIWLYVGITLFLFCALGQGLLISSISPTQQVAFMISVFSSLLPTFMLSGFIFPIRSMPVVLQWISNVVPTKYFLVIARSVMLKGTEPHVYWEQLLFLGIFAFITLAVSAVRLLKSKTV
ncbi:MAG: ABC transporter permease [Bacteroidetes bacterium]|nr:MAG: ABC transporter permease [Bacteroidota bacterium]